MGESYIVLPWDLRTICGLSIACRELQKPHLNLSFNACCVNCRQLFQFY